MFSNKSYSRIPPIFLNLTLMLALLISSSAFPSPVYADSVIMVATIADDTNAADGLCSLREAIINANDDAQTHTNCVGGSGHDTIQFNDALGTATITLGATLPTITDNRRPDH